MKIKSNAQRIVACAVCSGYITLYMLKWRLYGDKKHLNAINGKPARTGFQRSQGHSFTATEKLPFWFDLTGFELIKG